MICQRMGGALPHSATCELHQGEGRTQMWLTWLGGVEGLTAKFRDGASQICGVGLDDHFGRSDCYTVYMSDV